MLRGRRYRDTPPGPPGAECLTPLGCSTIQTGKTLHVSRCLRSELSQWTPIFVVLAKYLGTIGKILSGQERPGYAVGLTTNGSLSEFTIAGLTQPSPGTHLGALSMPPRVGRGGGARCAPALTLPPGVAHAHSPHTITHNIQAHADSPLALSWTGCGAA